MAKFANLFYFREIYPLGGTEQFLYEIAKKYHDKDITILYDKCDPSQLRRLEKLVRCIQRESNTVYKAKKAFWNFNTEAIKQVEADEHIFIAHAIYQELNMDAPVNNEKLTNYVGVSKYSAKRLKESAEKIGKTIEPAVCYNPISLEKPKKVVKIISAGRFDDEIKGGKRLNKLIEAVDRYANKHDLKYLWLIFTRDTKLIQPRQNVLVLPPRIDVRDFIADSDWLVQLSNDMETYSYSINEALGYGVGVVTTPLSILEELPIPDGANLVCDYDMKNADKIAEKMFTERKKFKYIPPTDGWLDIIANEPSTYDPPKYDTTVRCIKQYYDVVLGKLISPEDEPFKTTKERAKYLQDVVKFVKIEG